MSSWRVIEQNLVKRLTQGCAQLIQLGREATKADSLGPVPRLDEPFLNGAGEVERIFIARNRRNRYVLVGLGIVKAEVMNPSR